MRIPFFSSSVTPSNPSPERTVGHSGTAIFGGYVENIEKNLTLTGTEKYRTFSNIMSNTSIAAAGTRYFLNLISKAGWAVEPAEDTSSESRAEEIAEMVEFSMHDMETPWHRVIRRAGMYRLYGYSIQEWTAKMGKDGLINFLDISPRPQITIERWDADTSGKIFGVVQRSPQTHEEIYLPRRKLIYIVDDSISDSPEGLGLFRHIVEPSRRLSRYEQLEGVGFEGDLRGIPLARAPMTYLQEMVDNGKLSPEQKAAIEQPLKDFVTSHTKSPTLGMMLDSLPYLSEDDAASPSQVKQWDLELLKAGNTSQEAVASAIERSNREIARVLGVEQLLLGEGAGSHALSKDKTQAFATVVDSALQELAEAFDRDFTEPLFLLNGWDDEFKPKLKTKSINLRDILQITQALKDMAASGAMLMPDDPAILNVRDALGLERPITIPEIDPSLMGEEEDKDDEGDDDKPNDDDGGRPGEQSEGSKDNEAAKS